MIEISPKQEKAILIGIVTRNQSEEKVNYYLDELSFLLETAGGIPGRRFTQHLDVPDSKTYVGAGKLHEIRQYMEDHQSDLAVFDDELTPSQIRNIERVLQCKIIDRHNLILYIFAIRARTSYSRTQVELAQCEYLLPRLTRMWTHLQKQKGGIGLKGPGEKEIETDRRILRYRISLLKKKLQQIDRQKITQRQNRGKLVRVALVGYTNAGKSTLMNLLSKSNVFAENKLFATLDTTVRKMVIGNLPFLLSDTVGFIRKLPHTLIESFKSTLDEVREADLLLHVVDITHPEFEEQMDIVKQTLVEIQAADKPVILLFNKTDAYRHIEKDPDDLAPPTRENLTLADLEKTWIARANSPSLFISALKKANIDQLRKIIYVEVRKIHIQRYPYNDFLYPEAEA
ncbi:MAG: GTPase HflX [Bacteroidetes bacterium]|nr:GTPase HflX [Bacteroidota bacterium]